MSALKDQIDAIREKEKTWPDWVRKEIAAEVAKTPLKAHPPTCECPDCWQHMERG